MIVSFAWTVPALLAGQKTMTRRAWNPLHAAKFKPLMFVDAWDRLPRVAGSRKIATIRITRAPYLQHVGEMTAEDYRREGFAWALEGGGGPEVASAAYRIWHNWQQQPDLELYVLEFELVGVEVA